MTRTEKLALLDAAQRLHTAATDQAEKLRTILQPETFEPFWHVVDFAFEQVAARIGDRDAWLDWHAYDNKWGAERLKAGPSGNLRPIRNNSDLLDLIGNP